MTKAKIPGANLHTVDTGWAWLVAAAACFCLFFTCGFAYSTGVYYVTFLDTFQESKGVTAWISSLNFGVLCAVGPIASLMINSISCRFTAFLGGFLSSLGLFLSAFATSITMLSFTFGVLTGAGFGLVFTTCVVVISEYFVKYRVIAMGLSISGTGLGTIAYPWLSRWLISHYAWRGALLISAAINSHVCVAALFMRPNRIRNRVRTKVVTTEVKLPSPLDNGKDIVITKEREIMIQKSPIVSHNSISKPASSQVTESKGFLSYKVTVKDLGLDIFKQATFLLICINTVLFCFGMSVMYTHISAYAGSLHLEESARTLLISSIGFSNLVGRVALGASAQFLPIDTTLIFIISYFLAGLGILFCAVWTTFVGLMVCVCTFGFFSAGFGPLLSEVTCLAVGVMKFSMAYGYLMVFMALGTMIGAPLAGMLYDGTLQYQYSFYLGGSSLLLSSLILLPDILPSRWKTRKYKSTRGNTTNSNEGELEV